MAEISWPAPDYPTAPPDPSAGSLTDREYELLASRGMMDGFADPGTTLVYADATGLLVKIAAGTSARLRGFYWQAGNTDVVKAIASNSSGQTRYDVVALQLDRATWHLRTVVVQGTPGAAAPTLTADLGATGIWQLGMAQVKVVSGAVTILPTDVQNVAWHLIPQGIVTSVGGPMQPNLGQLAYIEETAELYLALGVGGAGGFRRISADTGWVDCGPEPSSPIGVFPAPHGPRVRRIGDVVHLKGGILGNSVAIPTPSVSGGWTGFYVPGGFRPLNTHHVGAMGGNTNPSIFQIDPNGVAWWRAGTRMAQPGENFLVQDSSWPVN